MGQGSRYVLVSQGPEETRGREEARTADAVHRSDLCLGFESGSSISHSCSIFTLQILSCWFAANLNEENGAIKAIPGDSRCGRQLDIQRTDLPPCVHTLWCMKRRAPALVIHSSDLGMSWAPSN